MKNLKPKSVEFEFRGEALATLPPTINQWRTLRAMPPGVEQMVAVIRDHLRDASGAPVYASADDVGDNLDPATGQEILEAMMKAWGLAGNG